MTFRCAGEGQSVFEVVVSLRVCAWSLDPSWWAGRLFAPAVSTVPGHRARPLARHRLRDERQRERRSMTPAGRAFHECRMQFHRHCVVPRIHVVRIATFVEAVESSLSRIACETAPSASCLRSSPRTWLRHFARGSDTSHVGPMACAWAAPPRTAASPPANGGNRTMRGPRSGSPHVEGATRRGELHQ